MANQEWVNSFGPWHTADATAVTASATLTELTPTPQILIPYPALVIPGTRIQFDAWGTYTTTGTQGTQTLDVRMGATAAIGSLTSIVATSALTWVASQTTRAWHINGQIDIRTIGTSGTAVGYMEVENLVSAATDVAGVMAITATTATVNTTITNAIAIGATNSVASQSITCRTFNVTVLN
jgi:hypothetical protein